MSRLRHQTHRRGRAARKAAVGVLALALAVGAGAPGNARPAKAKHPTRAAVDKTSAATSATRSPQHHHCAHGYPMHHWNPCGTMTGGPVGGLH